MNHRRLLSGKTSVVGVVGVVGLLTLAAPVAHAAIACSVSAAGFTSVYDALVATPNDNVSSYTLSCTRAVGDPTTASYTLAASNGLFASGVNNRASRGAAPNQYLRYDVYKDAGYASKWGNTGGSVISGILDFGSATSVSVTAAYYVRVPAGASVQVNSLYQDTVGVTLTYGLLPSVASTTFAANITTVPTVQIAVPPGNVAFNYNSFSATLQSASTSFVVRGTSGLTYTLALDSNSGSVLGLNYTLALSAAGGTANGALQTYTINGSMAAGQGGTCATGSCAASQARTLTVTY